jgi:hypothetical protein
VLEYNGLLPRAKAASGTQAASGAQAASASKGASGAQAASASKGASGAQADKGAKAPTIDRWQIHVFALPIKPAHAMTYHDCQGQTCRKVLLGNISRLFSTNMLYVGLSRAPSLDCVVLSDDFSQHHIKQDEDAISFFQ